MTSVFSSSELKAEALRLGFHACGIAKASAVDDETARTYRQWIAEGRHADMQYLANNIEKRLDPTLLLPGAQSIVVVAMSYAPRSAMPPGEYQIASYALGSDYHDIVKARLRQLLSILSPLTPHLSPLTPHPSPLTSKLCVDTTPILERYWAWQAGLGFIGRNHQLIIPHAGSMFFLGEIVTTAVFDHYDTPQPQQCGTCRRCIEACPTGTLSTVFDARRCISYQTIENRGAIADEVKAKLGLSIYGCDRCQNACPFNQCAPSTDIDELQPRPTLLSMTRERWHHLTREEYQQLFRGSAVKRAKYEGLMRNIQAAGEP